MPVKIRAERCKGCGLCAAFCPQGLLTLAEQFNDQGYHYALINSQEKCTGCATCARVCPDLVFEIYKECSA